MGMPKWTYSGGKVTAPSFSGTREGFAQVGDVLQNILEQQATATKQAKEDARWKKQLGFKEREEQRLLDKEKAQQDLSARILGVARTKEGITNQDAIDKAKADNKAADELYTSRMKTIGDDINTELWNRNAGDTNKIIQQLQDMGIDAAVDQRLLDDAIKLRKPTTLGGAPKRSFTGDDSWKTGIIQALPGTIAANTTTGTTLTAKPTSADISAVVAKTPKSKTDVEIANEIFAKHNVGTVEQPDKKLGGLKASGLLKTVPEAKTGKIDLTHEQWVKNVKDDLRQYGLENPEQGHLVLEAINKLQKPDDKYAAEKELAKFKSDLAKEEAKQKSELRIKRDKLEKKTGGTKGMSKSIAAFGKTDYDPEGPLVTKIRDAIKAGLISDAEAAAAIEQTDAWNITDKMQHDAVLEILDLN